jgi:aromatic-L-amino-acid/L-tryptophan decarboxylase
MVRRCVSTRRARPLARATAISGGAWRSFDRFRPGQRAIDDRVRELLDAELPEAPTPVLDAPNDVSRILDESIAQPRPRYFAFIGSCYDLNLAVDAAAATAVEAGRWVAAFVGYPADCAAAFTSGGTVSNITALSAARERALPRVRAAGMAGVRAAVYCSRDAHYSIVRAVEMLGLGANSLRSLPIDSRRRMVPEGLAEAVDADLMAGIVPVAVVATAGTTATGAVDPIDTIADICSQRGVWLHVDGAYGLPAASVSTHAPPFAGVSRADSICVDAHKWLYVPKPCSVCIVRRPGNLIRTFGHDPHYLPRDRAQQHAVGMTLGSECFLGGGQTTNAARACGATMGPPDWLEEANAQCLAQRCSIRAGGTGPTDGCRAGTW